MLNLGDCLSMDPDKLPSAVHLSTVQTRDPPGTIQLWPFTVFFNLESENIRFLDVTGKNTGGGKWLDFF